MPWIFCCDAAQTKSGPPCSSLLRHTWPYFPCLQPWSFLACFWPYITECFLGHWLQLKPTWPQCLSHPWKWCHDGSYQFDPAVTFCHRYRWVTICWRGIWLFLSRWEKHLKLRGWSICSNRSQMSTLNAIYLQVSDISYLYLSYKRYIKLFLLPA